MYKSLKKNYANTKVIYPMKASFIISLIIIFHYFKNYFLNINNDLLSIKSFEKYINECKHSNNIKTTKIFSDNPYMSVCLAVLNMRLYIKRNLLSIINQSFKDFEIIIVNDFSKDESEHIIGEFQSKDSRIKLINHSANLGTYHSRIEAILNAKGKYILLMDPDDMFLNQHLFKNLYKYNLEKNLDIIEFSVYQQKDGEEGIFLPNNHYETHYHNFPKEIIFQPELSNILFYSPGTKNYSKTICRNIWNKKIKRELLLKSNEYLGKVYYNEFVIIADDMIMNIVLYHHAKNYSNINLPGYLYNIRKVSMSRGDGGIKLKKIRTINHFQYFFLFYKYLKDYNKDRNFLMYEMKDLNHYILFIKDLNIREYIFKELEFLKDLLNDTNVKSDFRNYINKTINYFRI